MPLRIASARQQASTQGVGIDEERERFVAIDGDDRDPFSIACFELRIAIDQGLAKDERHLALYRLEHAPRALAEVSASAGVDDDLRLFHAG